VIAEPAFSRRANQQAEVPALTRLQDNSFQMIFQL